MKDKYKTKQQLIDELVELRKHVFELEAREADRKVEKIAVRSTEIEMRIKDSAIESSMNAVAFTDLAGSLIYVNGTFLDMWGWEREEDVLGSPLANFWIEEGKAWEIIRELRYKGRWRGEVVARKKDGSSFDVQVSANMVTNGVGDPICTMGSFVDITRRKEAEKALQESEEKYRRLFEFTREGILISGPDGNVVSANPAAASLLGYDSPEKIENLPMTDFYAELGQREKVVEELREKGYLSELEGSFRRKDGTVGEALASLTLHSDEEGNIQRIEGIFRDITERKRMEKELRDSEERYKDLVERAGIGILIDDTEGHLKYCNENFAELFGYSVEEIMGESIASLVHPDDVKRVIGYHTGRVQGETVPSRYEFRGIKKDGTVIYLEVGAMPIQEQGTVVGTRSYLWNITERKQAEEALRESEEKYRDLVETIGEIIYATDHEGVITYVSPAVQTFIGYTPFEVIGRHLSELVYHEDLADVRRSFQSILSGRSTANTYRILSKSGEIRWARTSSRPLIVEDRVIGVRGVVIDITEQKHIEDTLKDSEDTFRGLFENSMIGIYRTTPDGRILMANPELVRMLGYASFEELAQRNFEDEGFGPEYARSDFKDRIEKEGKVIGLEFVWTRRDGTMLFVRESVRGVKDEAGNILYYEGTVEDITERKRAEKALLDTKSQLEYLFDSTTVVIYRCEPSGSYPATFISRNITKQLGYEPEEFTKDPDFWADHIHPDDKSRVFDELSNLFEKNHHSHEYRFLHKDGSYRWMFDKSTLIRDDKGEPQDIIGSWVDITERRQAEQALRESEEKYRNLVERANDGIVIVQDRVLRFVNQRIAEIIGFTVDEMTNTLFTGYISEDQRPRVLDFYERRIAGEEVKSIYESALQNKDGHKIEVEFNAGLITYEGRLADLVIVRDISERKLAEERLQLLSSSVEQSSEGISVSDLDGNLLFVNHAFSDMHGYTPEELVGKDLSIFHNPEQMPSVEAAKQQLHETGTFVGEIWHTHRDGTVFPTIMHTSLLKDGSGGPTGMIGTMRDITDQKHSEAALRESELQYRTTIDSMADPVHVIDRDYRFVLFNKAFRRWSEELGLETDVVDRTVFDVFPFIQENVHDEYRHVFDTGETLITEENTEISGQEFITETRKIPVLEGKTVIRIVTVVRDITERKLAEEQIRASLREKEALLREIHHRVKNNLQVVSGLLLLQSRDIKDEQTIKMLEECQIRIKTLGMIHEKLYQTEDLARVDFAEYVSAFAAELIYSYEIDPDSIELRIHMEDILLNVDTAIPCGLIITELLSNSLKHAFPNGRKGVIQIDFFKGEEGTLTLIVKDNGIGFPEHIDFQHSSTLGLQLVNTLTDQLDGTIDLDGKDGTTFNITFPLKERESDIFHSPESSPSNRETS